MTLNDLERRNSPYFAFSPPNSIALQAYYVPVVKNRPIVSVKYCLPVPVFHFWPKLRHSSARSLCDSWATCYYTMTRPPDDDREVLYFTLNLFAIHTLISETNHRRPAKSIRKYVSRLAYLSVVLLSRFWKTDADVDEVVSNIRYWHPVCKQLQYATRCDRCSVFMLKVRSKTGK